MRILLDTHIFLWFITEDERLPESYLDHIRDPENEIFLSVVSLWEAIIKYQLGKLPLPRAPESLIPAERDYNRIANLDVDESCVTVLPKLPSIHRDPFDRLLICQAKRHGLTIATLDERVRSYPVAILDGN